MTSAPHESISATRKGANSQLLPCIVLAWCGAIVSYILLQEHEGARFLLCPSRAGCEAVLSSRYASFLGLPLPWVGAAFYLLVLVLLLVAYGTRSRVWRDRIVAAVVWQAVAALAFSGSLMWVQFRVLHAFCALCTASAAIVALLVATTMRAERRLAKAEADGFASSAWSLAFFAFLATMGLAVPGVLPREEVVAMVDGRKFTRTQMEADLAGGLQPLRRSIYDTEFEWVKAQVNAALLSGEALRRKVTIDQLLATRAMKDELLAEIAVNHQIEILLPKPPLKNIQFDLTKAQVVGPKDAKVKLVVFTDFQCEHCLRLAPVLERIRAEFPNDVLVAWRPYPLDAKPRAFPAAIAAECAAEQGAFWKYYDALFASKGDLSDERLDAIAVDLQLDTRRFAVCRNAGAARAVVEASYDEAVKLGIEGTPALFFNGTMIGGFVDFDTLARRIRRVLGAR